MAAEVLTMRRADARTDAELVALARDGDSDAYAAIYRRHAPGIRRIVGARLGSQGDPADAVQDVFTVAWRKLDTLRDPDQLRPWLGQIARRTAIDHGRGHRRRPVDLQPDEVMAESPDRGPGPEQLGALTDLAERLDEGMRSLSRRDALAISLATHFGFGPEEMAEALGVTPGNAKVILHRARQRLRATLTD